MNNGNVECDYCPSCNRKTLRVTNTVISIPYFGEVLDFTILCSNCGYRRADIMPIELKEPSRYSLNVESQCDVSIRIVKSSTCTIRIPELGVIVEPGPLSEGYISNVEGLLSRISKVISMGMKMGQDEEKEKGQELIDKINRLIEGQETVCIILEDPLGYSAIASDKAIKESLTEEELKELKFGDSCFEIESDIN
ncbi:MAG: ZPR1 zinc-finger domain protein [Candidatus Methanofastidiosum methylothiophilum]|uniref:ZPR1 zinc-finger domain protein n=1 Tax=Candidatus Methanofastidiosum methylothiophilum TaxID=1705564 RepID=A0A150II95_9EURY|nr:MAG: ZPR1 zinc-finger domain protein [Candidatus Methanofastidiosum methylthiophilus]KYC46756.1 MAG: ZPR1 zinc-finger domain protein [Candidatus Methanofastidiosum methylthiophilus]KYC49231.1 MAG: ZPR1 zinc-finger domain protein [Candidatus Methanofastidiosum methylthiophilus]